MARGTASRELATFDLFCGGGGSSHGAALAGAKPVAALDSWSVAADTYQLNFPHAKVYREPAADVRPEDIIREVGKIDLLLASPECTSHSIARGSRPGSKESRETAFEVIRFAAVLEPRWIVVENVLQMRRWSRYKEWLSKVHSLGYRTSSSVLDSQEYETPQSRRRLFIVGDRNNKPILPKPRTDVSQPVRTVLGTDEPQGRPWKFSPLRTPNRAEATIERAERAIKDLGDGEPFIMVYYSTDGAGGYQTLDRPLRTVTTVDRFAYVRKNGSGYEMRMLQPPELAAAMGFPSSVHWPSGTTRRNKIKILGNAVCPPVMRDIVAALIEDS